MRSDPKLTRTTLFSGKTAEEWRALYAGAHDWGPDVGRETVDDDQPYVEAVPLANTTGPGPAVHGNEDLAPKDKARG